MLRSVLGLASHNTLTQHGTLLLLEFSEFSSSLRSFEPKANLSRETTLRESQCCLQVSTGYEPYVRQCATEHLPIRALLQFVKVSWRLALAVFVPVVGVC
jgi:hypothetical protein